MKIFDAKGDLITEMRDNPRDFEGGHKRGAVFIGDEEFYLGRYELTQASEVVAQMQVAYIGGEPTFVMPLKNNASTSGANHQPPFGNDLPHVSGH